MHEDPVIQAETRVRTPRDLGLVLRKRRRQQGLTQEELALFVSSHRNRIRELEHGNATERLDLLLRALRQLGLELVVRPRDADRGDR